MSFQEIYSGQIITNATIKPDTPQFSKTNPLKSDVYVNGIELILSPEFSKKGAVLVLIDGNTKFNSVGTNSFNGYSKFPIPLKQLIQRDTKIEVFAWNKIDSNLIECNLNLSMSKEAQPFNSQAVPFSQDVINTVLSGSETLFPDLLRVNQTDTKLIDMQGYRKLIVILNQSNPEKPISVTAGNELTIDGKLNTANSYFITSTPVTIIWEWDSIKIRALRFKWLYHDFGSGSSDYDYDWYISDDGIDYTLLLHQDLGFAAPSALSTLNLGNVSSKYVKLIITPIVSGNRRHDLYELYDLNQIGGSGDLSFEVLGDNSWNIFIPSSEFGTISDGDNSIVTQIGDVITKSISGKTYVLPSTQTSFRAKYVITGSLKNSISILKVA